MITERVEEGRYMEQSKIPLGLYVHIPFCVKKCAYCDFLSMSATEQMHQQYVDALLKELESIRKESLAYTLQTIYFGGGTPSVLNPYLLEKIIKKIEAVFNVNASELKEVTLEVNPGTASKEKWNEYYRMGINRISLGLQSTHDDELQKLGRIHSFHDFLENYQNAREAGFSNISVDLMSGLPGQTIEKYQESLEKVAKLLPEHISSYSLIVEEGTPFWKWYGEQGSKLDELPTEEEDREMYELTKNVLKQYGYHRYEISNYAKEGYESVHNSSYWVGTAYYGVGLGASSYFGNCRYQNISDFQSYLKNSSKADKRRILVEELTIEDKMTEFVILGLRRMCGISRKEFWQRFHKDVADVYKDILINLENKGLLKQEADRILLTDKGIDVSNYVFSELLL